MAKKFCLLLLALALVFTLAAQNTGRLSGSVQDASGAALPGATVNLYVAGGAAPVATVTTSQEGIFFFPGVQPVVYDLSIEAKGFQKVIRRNLKVDSGLELSLPATKLDVASQTEVVEVSATVVGVQTSNAEVATTITNEQVRRLPTLNRSPLALLDTQAGVGGNGRTNRTINGLRPSYANITIDGINIQDNFIRANTLSFQPNMLLIDQVGEMTISTSNTLASDGSGAAQLKFTTPSGTNSFHGNLYWFNRNNAMAANTWFNNRNKVSRPFLNQNQGGGSIGGPIKKDKLFFYANYEAIRLRQQSAATRTILTPDARKGIFTYRDTAGALRQVNVLTAAGVGADPKTAAIIGQIPEVGNRPDLGDVLNTTGLGFNVRNNRTRDQITAKADWLPTSKNSFSTTVLWNRDVLDRPDLANDYSAVPKVANDGATKLWSGTWRWSPTATTVNELRGGFNFAPARFITNESFGSSIIALPLSLSNPLNTFRAQGRYTNTWNFSDNVSMFKGKHTFMFGGNYMKIHTDPYNDVNNIPVYTLGISAANTNGLNADKVPGVRAADLATANGLLSLMAGYVTSGLQQFNATAIGSGYVPGAAQERKMRMENYAGYFSDTWRMSNRLTLTLGARWEFYTPVTEANGLMLLPVIQNGNVIQTLLNPNGTLDYAGTVLKRPYYGKDWNNVSPNVGMAWQPFGDSKTVIRAGYSINYPNDDFIRAVDNNVLTNAGLSATRNLQNLTSTVNGGLPAVPTPAFKVPRTYADNYALDTQSAFGMPDPNLRTPYVQQWSLGIQREIFQGVLDVRYVGNRATKSFRAFDYNQVVVKDTAYLTDFKGALNNGNLARNATGVFNPAYNPAISGSVPLPFFNANLASGGLLNNATIRGQIERGEVGELATTYQVNGLTTNGYSFFRNPRALGTNMMSNYSNANYNALQIDYRRFYAAGFQVQANYTYGKVMSDASGDAQTLFEPFLDIDNGKIERARTPFDYTHAIKANGVWDIPVGKGRKVNISNTFADLIIGGWSVSGLFTWQSGAPFSILSSRGTLNRGGRSGQNTAIALTGKSALDSALSFRQTGNGPYMVAASAIGSDGRGVNADGRAPYDGQLFYNPGPGALGTLQRRMFSGPQFVNVSAAILKRFNVSESNYFEFRGEAFNLTNTPSFFIGDQSINSTTFGRITSTVSDRRVLQFGLLYRF
jgi:hypothetical protein